MMILSGDDRDTPRSQGYAGLPASTPIAEEIGLIDPLGQLVLRTACTHARIWQHDRDHRCAVAANISLYQVRQPNISTVIAQILEDTGLDPQRLKLELTERAAMQQVETSIAMMDAMKALGADLSIDDFGTGYSSLSYLQRLPIATLTIDRSVISAMLNDPHSATIVRTLITLARGLHVSFFAEGVETEAQLAFLREHGCDAIQGYLVSRALPFEAATEFLARAHVDQIDRRALAFS